MELFSAKTGPFDDKTQPPLMRQGDGGGKVVAATGHKDGHRRAEMVSSPTEDTITSSSSLSSISSLSTASTLSSYIEQVLPSLPPSMDNNDNAHCTPNASINCSTHTISSSSTNNPALLLVEPVTLEPFSHQVGGHSSVLRFDATTVCKPLIQREKKFYESKLPTELKPFVPQFRGILEVKIVDEQDGFLSLEGHKIFGSAEVLDYHRTQSLNNSQASQSLGSGGSGGGGGPVISQVKSAIRSKSSAAAQNGENCEKPIRYRFRRTGSIEIPSSRNNGNEEKSVKSSAQKESRGSSRESRPSSSSSKHPQHNSSMVINPWNVKMVKAELEKMRRKDTNNKYKFLLQENAVHSFRCPTIIDLKMGTRQYGDDASEEKKKRFIAKSEMSTTAKLGVRLCGLQVYHVPMKKYIYVNKYKGRHCSVDGFKRILFMFLYNGSCLRLDVVDVVLAKLRDLHDIVSKLKSYRFFSSSLLIGYDASPQAVSTPLPSPSSMDASSSSADHVDNGTCASLNQKCSTQSEPKEQSLPQSLQQQQQQQQRQALATSAMVNNKNVLGSQSCGTLTPSPQPAISSSSASTSNMAQQTPLAPASSLSSSSSSSSSSRLTASNPISVATENLASPLVDMKMIDFAHTTTSGFADEIVYEGPDDGYLFGLQSMIRIFEDIKRMSPAEHQQIISTLNADSLLSAHASAKT